MAWRAGYAQPVAIGVLAGRAALAYGGAGVHAHAGDGARPDGEAVGLVESGSESSSIGAP